MQSVELKYRIVYRILWTLSDVRKWACRALDDAEHEFWMVNIFQCCFENPLKDPFKIFCCLASAAERVFLGHSASVQPDQCPLSAHSVCPVRSVCSSIVIISFIFDVVHFYLKIESNCFHYHFFTGALSAGHAVRKASIEHWFLDGNPKSIEPFLIHKLMH